jgi:hypothetical protein
MIRTIVLSFVSVAISFAQPSAASSAWNIVGAVGQGHKIRVETPARKYTGTFVGISDSAISLQSESGQVSVPKGDVMRIYSQSRSNRIRNTLIGAGIGAAIGITTYGTLGTLLRNEGGEHTGVLLAAPIGAGTAIGAALPTGGMKKIYDAKEDASR